VNLYLPAIGSIGEKHCDLYLVMYAFIYLRRIQSENSAITLDRVEPGTECMQYLQVPKIN